MKDQCVFCQIVKGENFQKERVIRDDDNFVAMLVSHPETKGHFIVFPKKHFCELIKMKRQVGKLMEVTTKWAEEMVGVLEAKAYVLKLNNGLYKLEDDPLHVGHIHMHVVPRYLKEDKVGGKLTEADDAYFCDLLKILQTKR